MGTTTFFLSSWSGLLLYHYERKLGTTTGVGGTFKDINYTTTRENWELRPAWYRRTVNGYYTTTRENWELRPKAANVTAIKNYTTTRENWELRLIPGNRGKNFYYTTTRENWELRLVSGDGSQGVNYTTTRENWELRHFRQSYSHQMLLYHYERKLGTTTAGW